MQNQTFIKILVLAALLLAASVWLWPSSDREDQTTEPAEKSSNRLVSAIQPINDADALTISGELPQTVTEAPVAQPEQRDQKDFEQALAAIQAGDYSSADSLLGQIIERQPGLLEPYINLASVQAARGDLEEARKTLDAGLNVNQNYGALYKNLKRVHAALAADAYRQALAEEANSSGTEGGQLLELPIVTNLNPAVVPGESVELADANKRIAELESSLKSQQALLSQRQQELLAANASLERELQSTSSLRAQLQTAETAASESLVASSNTNNRILALETQLASAQTKIAQMERAHQDELSALQTEVMQQKEALASQQRTAQIEEQRLNAQIAALTQNSSQPSATVAVATESNSGSTDQNNKDENAERLAIERVKGWASAWSNQDVESYIEHYRDGYTPLGSGISHADWRAQRQVRLTNKRFIEVTLSNFETSRNGDQISVTFTQRYRSNTMDDTIRKQLVLTGSGDSWQRAKIISEKVIR